MATSNDAAALLKEVKALGALTQDQEEWCNEACCQRYLRARHQHMKKAAQMLRSTITWRSQMDIGEKHNILVLMHSGSLSKGQFTKDLGTGRMYCAGTDPDGHALLVTRKRADGISAGEHEAYLRFLVYSLETCVRAMQHGREGWVWLMDMQGYSRANSPPISVSLKTLHILADHYPERLHRCYFINAPPIFGWLFSALSPFIDKVTRAKITFINTQDYAMEIEQYRSAPADQKLTVQDAMRTADPAKAFRNYIAAYCEQYDAVQYGMLLDKLWPGAGKGDEKLASDQQ